jgi:hypothetical protein
MNLHDLSDDQLHDLRLDLESAVECGCKYRDDRESEALLWLVTEEQTRRELETMSEEPPYWSRPTGGTEDDELPF